MPKITDAERALRKSCACGTLLRKDNSDGICRPCRKAARSTNGKSRGPVKSQRTPPRKPVAKSVPSVIGVSTPATGIATICVTEQHMDHFWSKLSLEEKANIFQMQLEAAR